MSLQMNQTNHILVLTTWPDIEEARNAARQFLDYRLAACINILPPMESLYLWNGEEITGHEHQMFIKTSTTRFKDLQQAIQKNHPYELPEIIAIPIVGGLPAYLSWIGEITA